jgi:hypothetical protein
MNRRPGQVDVITEVGYCPACGRTRSLRREEHHLGALVRTIVSCESCHRTLSSSIGVASAEPAKVEPEPQPVAEAATAQAKAPAKRPVTKKPAAKKPAAKKTPAKKTPAKKPTARGGKPTSSATRKSTRTR